jgi:uncharacterized ubiquitin-like protein YukD
MTPGAQAQDAGTVAVRVQVIDVESAALDLVVPTYLPAKDVTQRIARDANLGAYWPDGSRRQFWIRARGRLLGPEERLQDLGVLNGELIHILPQPPEGSGVIERTPEYPKNKGYRGGNMVVMIGSFLWMLAFAILWGVALTVPLGIGWSIVVCALPAIALALLCVTTARHLFGPPGSHVRIPAVGLVLFLPVFIIALLPGFLVAEAYVGLGIGAGAGFFAGIFGVVMGWLAWFGAVEQLPDVNKIEQKEAARVQAQVAPCAICGQNIDLTNAETRQDCVYGCGRVFHAGCYRARASIAREGQCAVCGYTPGAA